MSQGPVAARALVVARPRANKELDRGDMFVERAAGYDVDVRFEWMWPGGFFGG